MGESMSDIFIFWVFIALAICIELKFYCAIPLLKADVILFGEPFCFIDG
jgi:hypothetical protein